MRLWVQVFSSRERNPNFHIALEQHLQSVVEPGAQVEVHGTRKGGLGARWRRERKSSSLAGRTPCCRRAGAMAEAAVKIQRIMGTFVSRKLLYQIPGEVVRARAKQEYGIDLS